MKPPAEGGPRRGVTGAATERELRSASGIGLVSMLEVAIDTTVGWARRETFSRTIGGIRCLFCAREVVNNVRLNSAIGYITPKDMLAGHQQEIQAERDQKLEAARKPRQIRRQQAA